MESSGTDAASSSEHFDSRSSSGSCASSGGSSSSSSEKGVGKVRPLTKGIGKGKGPGPRAAPNGSGDPRSPPAAGAGGGLGGGAGAEPEAGGEAEDLAHCRKVLERASEMIAREAAFLEAALGEAGAPAAAPVFPQRMADVDMFESAVDAVLAEAAADGAADAAEAARRLGLAADAGGCLRARLESGRPAGADGRLAGARAARLRHLRQWAALLPDLAGALAREEASGTPPASDDDDFGPLPSRFPRLAVGCAPAAPGWGHGCREALFLGLRPVEAAHTLYRRVYMRRRREGRDVLGAEEAAIRARLRAAAGKGGGGGVKKGRSLAAKRLKRAGAPDPRTDPLAAAKQSVAARAAFWQRLAEGQQKAGERLDAIGRAIYRQRAANALQQEREDERARVRVARALNKTMVGFWSHATKLVRKTTREHIASKKREILNVKKDMLLQQAVDLTRQLSAALTVKEESGEARSVPIPSTMTGGGRTLRVYQRTGLNWLVTLYEKGMNGILADEMGLGKTIQTIALLAHLAVHERIWGPHLIVVPTSVLLNWEIEFKRWAPGFKLLVYYGTQKVRQQKRKGWTLPGAFNVCLASYQTVVADEVHFRRIFWEYMILDEAQLIKNWKSKKWQGLHVLHTTRRLLLTGTPLQNNVMEIWSLLRFLMHENPLFASDSNFNHWFSSPMTAMLEVGSCDNTVVEQLHQLLRPYILRRLKRQVEAEMPKKIEKVLRCRLSKRQRTLYDEYMTKSETQKKLQRGYLGAMGVLMALRMVCNHPDLFESRPVTSPLVYAAISSVDNDESGPRSKLLDLQPPVRQGYYVVPRLIAKPFDEGGARGGFALRAKMVQSFGLALTSDCAVRCRDQIGFTNSLLSSSLAQSHRKGKSGRVRDDSDEPGTKRKRKADDSDIEYAPGDPGLFGYDELRANKHLKYADDRRDTAAWRAYLASLHEAMLHVRDEWKCWQAKKRDISRKRAECAYLVGGPEPFFDTPGSACGEGGRFTACFSDRAVSADLYSISPIELQLPTWARQLLSSHNGRTKARSPTEGVNRFEFAASATEHRCEREGRHRELLKRFCCILPKVISPSYRPSWSDPGWEDLCNRILQRTPPETAHPDLLTLPDPWLLQYDCGKLQVLAFLLPQLKAKGHRALIFTQMTRMLDILETFLSLHGFVYLRLDGSTKVEERQYRMELFNNDTRYFCFILSTRSGGMGINLTGADTVIFYDSDWNPAMDLQAQDRCHRIGQTRDVTVYRLTSKHTVEENILVKARQKKTLVNLVIKGGRFEHSAAAAAKKTNVLEFFHHLDDDELMMLQKAESGVEIEDIDRQDVNLQDSNLIELEEDVDRQAFQRYRTY
ncbi:Helicase domino [Diplonema papillatum]|nr:Helicase domino [Diplonema papillatum]